MTVPTTSRRCGPLWRKRRGERPFCAKDGAVRKEGRAVVKEITRAELKAKMDRGTTWSSWRHSRGHTTRAATCRVRSPPVRVRRRRGEGAARQTRRDRNILHIDEECEASGEEARELVEMGYINVVHYAGRQAGLDQGRPPRGGRTPPRVRRKGANPRAGAP